MSADRTHPGAGADSQTHHDGSRLPRAAGTRAGGPAGGAQHAAGAAAARGAGAQELTRWRASRSPPTAHSLQPPVHCAPHVALSLLLSCAALLSLLHASICRHVQPGVNAPHLGSTHSSAAFQHSTSTTHAQDGLLLRRPRRRRNGEHWVSLEWGRGTSQLRAGEGLQAQPRGAANWRSFSSRLL